MMWIDRSVYLFASCQVCLKEKQSGLVEFSFNKMRVRTVGRRGDKPKDSLYRARPCVCSGTLAIVGLPGSLFKAMHARFVLGNYVLATEFCDWCACGRGRV